MRWRHITSERSRPLSPQGPTGFHQRQRQGNRTASVAATVFYLVLCTSLSGYGRNTGTRGSLSQQLHSRQFEPRCKVFLDIPSEDEQNQQSDWWFQPPLKKYEKDESQHMCWYGGTPFERNSLTGWGIFNPSYEWSECPVQYTVQRGWPTWSRMKIEVKIPFNLLFRGGGGFDPLWRLKTIYYMLISHSIYFFRRGWRIWFLLKLSWSSYTIMQYTVGMWRNVRAGANTFKKDEEFLVDTNKLSSGSWRNKNQTSGGKDICMNMYFLQ